MIAGLWSKKKGIYPFDNLDYLFTGGEGIIARRRGITWITIMRYHPDGPWWFGGSGSWGKEGV